MTIGIAGARGFIGAYLLQDLLKQSLGNVVALYRRAHTSDPQARVQTVYGDLLSAADCEGFVRELDALFYLAHCNSPVNSDFDQPSDVGRNLVPFLTLLQAVQRRRKLLHIIYFGSGGAVYGRSSTRSPFRESDPCAPVSSYGIQKLAAEHYLRLATEHGYAKGTVLRIGNAYGTLLPTSRLQGLIGVATNNVLHGHPVRVFGSLDNVRDYVHLDDICSISKLVLEQKEQFSVINVGSGVGYSVREVLAMIEKATGLPLQIELQRDVGSGLTDWVVLDVDAGKHSFGWVPKIQLQTGINTLVDRYTEELLAASAANASLSA